jgi:hypothetical protein
MISQDDLTQIFPAKASGGCGPFVMAIKSLAALFSGGFQRLRFFSALIARKIFNKKVWHNHPQQIKKFLWSHLISIETFQEK